MTDQQKKAYEWAKQQKYGSVAATYARELAGVIDELQSQLAEANRRADAAIKEMKLIVDAVREEHCDDTCCFACMFDCDTSITWTGDHANECPGFELNDCFLWRGVEKGN